MNILKSIETKANKSKHCSILQVIFMLAELREKGGSMSNSISLVFSFQFSLWLHLFIYRKQNWRNWILRGWNIVLKWLLPNEYEFDFDFDDWMWSNWNSLEKQAALVICWIYSKINDNKIHSIIVWSNHILLHRLQRWRGR